MLIYSNISGRNAANGRNGIFLNRFNIILFMLEDMCRANRQYCEFEQQTRHTRPAFGYSSVWKMIWMNGQDLKVSELWWSMCPWWPVWVYIWNDRWPFGVCVTMPSILTAATSFTVQLYSLSRTKQKQQQQKTYHELNKQPEWAEL